MYKRIFREILENWIRYLALMVMTIIAVGMYIGFLCGTSSSETAFVNYQTENKVEIQAENLRKMFLAMAK